MKMSIVSGLMGIVFAAGISGCMAEPESDIDQEEIVQEEEESMRVEKAPDCGTIAKICDDLGLNLCMGSYSCYCAVTCQ